MFDTSNLPVVATTIAIAVGLTTLFNWWQNREKAKAEKARAEAQALAEATTLRQHTNSRLDAVERSTDDIRKVLVSIKQSVDDGFDEARDEQRAITERLNITRAKDDATIARIETDVRRLAETIASVKAMRAVTWPGKKD